MPHCFYSGHGETDRAIADYSEAVRLDPRDAETLRIGGALLKNGDLQNAIHGSRRGSALKANWPFYYEFRAIGAASARLRCGAIADLKAAVRLNPGDPAARFEAWPKARLTKADLEHGCQQVHEMLLDRPPMAQFGARPSEYQWAARKFAGEGLGERIYWEDVPPLHFATGDHSAPRQPSPPESHLPRNTPMVLRGARRADSGNFARSGVRVLQPL